MNVPRCCIALYLSVWLTQPLHAQDPRLDSVPSGDLSSTVLQLGLRDVVDRALRNNLATILGSEAERLADAERLQDRADLFPKIDAFIAGESRQVSLAAFGFSGFPGFGSGHRPLRPFRCAGNVFAIDFGF